VSNYCIGDFTSNLPTIAAILTGHQPDTTVEDKVNYYFVVLRELERQTEQRNNPSMRNLINRVKDGN